MNSEVRSLSTERTIAYRRIVYKGGKSPIDAGRIVCVDNISYEQVCACSGYATY